MKTPFEEQTIQRFRELGLEPMFRLNRKVFSDKTGMQVIERFLLSALAQQRESIVKEIREKLERAKGYEIEHSPTHEVIPIASFVDHFLDSLTSSVPEKESVLDKSKFPYHYHYVNRETGLDKCMVGICGEEKKGGE